MERGFRLCLRAGFVLLILAAVVLVFWTSITGEGAADRRSPRESRQAAATPEDAGTASARAEEGTSDGTPASSGAAEEPENGDSPAPEGGRSEVQDFVTKFFDEERNREEGQIRGESMKSIAGSDDHLVEVLRPIVDLYQALDNVEVGPVDTQVRQVRLTADGAVVNQRDRVLRLSGNVVVQGEDFRITTDSVIYEGRHRLLSSDDPVRIERFATGNEDAGSRAMIVSGVGLDVDLAVESMAIRRDVEAKLFGVSDEFLAAGNGDAQGAGDAAGAAVESVIITASGKMNYANASHIVDFHDNVKAVSGGRVLTSDALQIVLSESSDEDSMEVKDITATGLVELTHQGQTARGDVLKWGNVTQTGTLTGSPASVVSDEFDIQGEKLTFYRLNERFNCQGVGRLLWKAAPKAEEAPEAAAEGEAAAWDVGPLKMDGEGPIRVDWTTTMTYQVDAGLASFGGGVRARQGDSSLDCEQLVLTFDRETRALEKITAEQDVKIHDARAEGGRDVTCHRLLWNATDSTVDLYAREGDVVKVKAGPNAIESARVVLDNARQSLTCPTRGRLTVEGSSAPGEGEAATQEEPITVTWSETMTFVEQPKPLATFRGSVFARRGNESIEGDRLALDFDEDTNPVKITVTGNAVIDVQSEEQPEEAIEPAAPASPTLGTVRGGHWRFGAATVTILVPEEQIRTQTPGRLTVSEGEQTTVSIAWQESAYLDWKANHAEFTGDVDSATPGSTLKCSRLKLDFDDERNLRNIWAEGGIEFQQERQDIWHLTSESAQAVFAGQSQLRQVIALGDVKVHDKTHTLTTDSMQLFLSEPEGGGDPQVVRAVAQGDVHIVYREGEEGPVEAGGDHLQWRRERDVYLLTGKPDAYVQRGGVKFSSDKMQIDRESGVMQALPDARPVTTTFLVPLR